MRHRKHNHLLGVKTAHRTSLIANLSCSLIDNGRITTTLAKARALRPSIEKAITLAKKAHASDDAANKVHYRRLAIARLRSQKAVKKLFDELVEQFVGRNGGYTRIYKLAIPRLGDAADMAIIEFVEEIQKKNPKKKRTTKDDAANKVHYRRLAIARLRSQKAVKKLFDELVEQFVGRNGGYTRIYKLAIPRLGDAADMAIIEFVEEIQKKNPKKKRTTKKAKEKLEASSEVKEDLPNEEKVSDTIVESNDQSVVEEKIATSAAKDESIEEVSGKESEPKKAKKKSSKTKAEDKDPE